MSNEESNPPEKKYVKMGTVIRETVKVEKKEKNNSESEDWSEQNGRYYYSVNELINIS